MKSIKDLRILHILSCVKWDGNTFNANADANWKVALKTINFLPNCHHYILVPRFHNIGSEVTQRKNVSLVQYDYPRSVQLNRGMFDYRNIVFDFKRVDVDFVFNHQPELTYNIQQWFSTNRYYESPSYFGFYHWIDCPKSRGSKGGTPKFFLKQLESMHIQDCSFVHSDASIDYLQSNFKNTNIDARELINSIHYMPLTSVLDKKPTPFDLPNKKILLFNHRFTQSSGIKRFIEYIKDLPSEYLVWITDDNCDLKADNVKVRSLPYSDYIFLLDNIYASLCFIQDYTTWNLSAQDSLIRNKPILCYDHFVLRKVIGNDYKGFFKNKGEFLSLLNELPQTTHRLHEHDVVFELQLKSAMVDCWKDTQNKPKDADAWRSQIEKGVVEKHQITHNVNPNIRMNNTAHFIRRNLLHNGVRDDINKPYTQYYIEGNPITIKRDLFSQF